MLEGSATKLCNPLSVAVDIAADELVVSNSNVAPGSCAQSVATYNRSASGNAAPKRTIAGTLSLNLPSAAAITSASGMNVKTKAIDANVKAGDTVSYTITATSTGGPVLNVVLTDMLPAGLTWSITAGDTSILCSLRQHADLLDRKLAKGGSISAGLSQDHNQQLFCNRKYGDRLFNDGTANNTAASSPATINVKCR